MPINDSSERTMIFDSSKDRVQRSEMLDSKSVHGSHLIYPYKRSHIDVGLNDLRALTLTPPNINKPQPPSHSAPDPASSHTKPSNEITYPPIPQRSATDSYLLTSYDARYFIKPPESQPWQNPNPSHRHHLDYLPTIETRLDAWVQENQHHAAPSPDEDTHELRCDKCRFGIGLVDVQDPNVTGKNERQWYSPKVRQVERSTQKRLWSCTMSVAKLTVPGSLVTVREVDENGSGSESGAESEGEETGGHIVAQQMQESKDRKMMQDKPSFRGFLVRVGGLKGQ